MLDAPLELDIDRLHEAVATAEVLTVFFPWFGRALIMDARHDSLTPPAVFSDAMAGSAEERLRGLAWLRPQLPWPERLTAVPWPAGTDSFVDSGGLDAIRRRLHGMGFGHLEINCRRALGELRRAEARMKLAYARGEHCRTLYQRTRR